MEDSIVLVPKVQLSLMDNPEPFTLPQLFRVTLPASQNQELALGEVSVEAILQYPALLHVPLVLDPIHQPFLMEPARVITLPLLFLALVHAVRKQELVMMEILVVAILPHLVPSVPVIVSVPITQPF